jgi:hypothetical protein
MFKPVYVTSCAVALQVSQMVIAYADYKIRQQDPRFPVGQARLEAIGVLACKAFMRGSRPTCVLSLVL